MIAQEQEIAKPYMLTSERERERERERDDNLHKFRKKSAAIKPLQKKSNGQ